MEINDIVNIKSSNGGYWRGKVTEITDEYICEFKDGTVFKFLYTSPISKIQRIKGIGISHNHSILF